MIIKESKKEDFFTSLEFRYTLWNYHTLKDLEIETPLNYRKVLIRS